MAQICSGPPRSGGKILDNQDDVFGSLSDSSDSLARVSPENALFPRNTRCKISHCQNFDLKTSFMNVISYLWCNEGEFAPTRETRLALSFDSNLFGFVT